MNKYLTILMALLFATLSLNGCIGGNEFDTTDLDQQIIDLENANDELNETILEKSLENLELQQQISMLNLSIDEKDTLLESYNSSVFLLERAILEFELNISSLRNQITDIENTRDSLIETLTNTNSTLADIQSQLHDSNTTLELLEELLSEREENINNWKLSFEDNLDSLEFLDLSGLDFSGLNLTNSVLSNANLSHSNLTGVDLTGSELINVRAMNLVGCPAILPSDWKCVNFNLVGPTANLNGANLSNGQLDYVSMADAELKNANLVGANLSNANLKGADLTSANLNATNLTFVHGVGLHGVPAYLPDGWSIVNFNLMGKYADLSGADLRDTQLLNMDLSNANLTGADFSGSTMVNVDFNEAVFKNLRAMDVQISGVKFPPDWSLRYNSFIGPYANLHGLSVERPDFANSNLQGVNLSDSYLPQIDLSNSDMSGADFSGSIMNGADLSYTVFDDANLSHTDLSNAMEQNIVIRTYFLDTSMDNANLSYSKFAGKNHQNLKTSYSDLDLSTATLTGIEAVDLLNCPAILPSDWECVNQQDDYGRDFGFLLVGKNAQLEWSWLTGADLSSSKLSGAVSFAEANLKRVNLSGLPLSGNIDFSSAELEGADLTGLDLTEANLYQVKAMNLKGCPALLPSGWICGNFNLIGPTAVLSGANLSGVDMSGVILAEGTSWSTANGVNAVNLQECPLVSTLGFEWHCIENNLVGPGASLYLANLQNANLSRYDLRGIFWGQADISGADLTGANLEGGYWISVDKNGVTWSNTICPDGTNSDDNGGSC